MSERLIRKIAVICKDYYVNRTIDDLFLFSGAKPDWYQSDDEGQHGSSRMNKVYGWVNGIRSNNPEKLPKILHKVSLQLLDNDDIDDGDKKFIKRQLNGFSQKQVSSDVKIKMPTEVDHLLEIIIQGLTRAMYPLKHRRKNATKIDFDSEYDLQSLLHSLLAPWVKDIRPEEYTPSYAGSSARLDFLLPLYSIVVETKVVRDSRHAKQVGDELIIDVDRYRIHPNCEKLFVVIYDPQKLIANPNGLISDLEGDSNNSKGSVEVRPFIIH